MLFRRANRYYLESALFIYEMFSIIQYLIFGIAHRLPSSASALRGREDDQGSSRSQRYLPGISSRGIEARAAPRQDGLLCTVGTAICPLRTRRSAARTNGNARQGLFERSQATGQPGAMAGQSGPGGTSYAVSGLRPAAVRPPPALLSPRAGGSQGMVVGHILWVERWTCSTQNRG